jgi:hypothetical protein
MRLLGNPFPSYIQGLCAELYRTDIFRCAFVVGAVASLSQISGEGGRLLLSHWVSDCLPTLSAISTCCTMVISQDVHLAEAAKAMDIWAEDTGISPFPSSRSTIPVPR